MIKTKEVANFRENDGFLYQYIDDIKIKNKTYNYKLKIAKDSQNYFKGKYSNATYNSFSQERIGYLDKIKEFAKKHNIKLYTYLTPVHCYHLKKIQEHPILSQTLIKFKKLLATKFDYIDFMIENDYNCKDENFYDAVHQTYCINNLIANDLFLEKPIYGEKAR